MQKAVNFQKIIFLCSPRGESVCLSYKSLNYYLMLFMLEGFFFSFPDIVNSVPSIAFVTFGEVPCFFTFFSPLRLVHNITMDPFTPLL